MLESIPTQIDSIFSHRIKHERIVRIWRMPQGKDFAVIVHHCYSGSIIDSCGLSDRLLRCLTKMPEDLRNWKGTRSSPPSSQKQNSRRDLARRLFEILYACLISKLIDSRPLEASA